MPKYRKLHVKTTESLDINDMPDDFTRLLWVMLPLGLCREGRGIDNPSWIRAKLMPLRSDVSDEMVEQAMNWYADRGMIVRYDVSNRNYFYVPSFHKYQGNTTKEAESDYPPAYEPVLNENNNTQELVQSNSRPNPEQVKPIPENIHIASAYMNIESVFNGYSEEIGVLTPLISESIQDYWDDIPEANRALWFKSAIEKAAANNKRSWAYIRAILDKWIAAGAMTTWKQEQAVEEVKGYTRA